MSTRFVLPSMFLVGSLIAACGTEDVEPETVNSVGAEPTLVSAEPTITADPAPTPKATLKPKPTARPKPSRTPTPTPITIKDSVDAGLLQDELVALGATVEIVGHVKFNALFGRWPSELTVNDQAVRIYEFGTADEARIASETVSSGGYSFSHKMADDVIMTQILDWVESPHFYLFSNSIVLYFGDDGSMGELLDSIGTKFAGRLLKNDADFESVVVPAVVDKVNIWSPQPDMTDYTVAVFLRIGQCEEKNGISLERLDNEFHFTATKRIADPPAKCTGEGISEGESFKFGSDFEPGVEYRVIVNGDEWNSFVGGEAKIPDW